MAFLLTNLFVQVPLSVLGVLLTNNQTFANTSPYPTTKINQDFTCLGFPVGKILPVIANQTTPQDHSEPSKDAIQLTSSPQDTNPIEMTMADKHEDRDDDYVDSNSFEFVHPEELVGSLEVKSVFSR